MTGKGKGKGKEVDGKPSAGKRKNTFDDDKAGGRKRNNRGVLQFFDDAAVVDEDDDEDSDDIDSSDDSFEDEEFETLSTRMNEPPAKGQSSLPVPKEELVDEDDFVRIMEERYSENSGFVTFAGDEFDGKPIDPNSLHPGVKESLPTIWKVKCIVGRERLSVFCLMQKFVDLKSLGTNLKIISAFAVEHMKGFVYIEAERQCDINEACQGISGIYVTRVQPVPRSEVHHLFSVRSRKPEISEGMWARIKSGNYKGDLAQVVAVNNTSKKVTVKLIPRIDLQALAAKFGGGYSRQKTAVPAPRLICSSELEEFRPLMQIRRDRDTGKVFEVLDGLLLKDGYVYKKVSPDSLSLWGVVPTEEELLKFGSSENNESNDLEWLSQLYGDSKKKRVIRSDKGGGKGESSSGSGVANGFELYDLVCLGKKDFGVIIGMDKDDSYRILKESPEGPVAVTVQRHEIKSGLFDLKLSAQDQHTKTILVNDNVRVLEGPSKGKQGIVKHIYRGIVFFYDENEEENGGYVTAKANMCEKVKLTVGDFSGKDSEPGPLVFDDQPSSPRSPLSPKKPWQARENNREFNRGDKDGLFTIGQTLRIRIGPLKGYLCRVIGLRRSDVTVKLDSQQKVLDVKREHLSEVQGKSTAMSSSDPESSSLKPFDLLGTEGSSGGWMDGVGTSTGGGGWNAGGTSAERSAWSNPSASSFLKPESTSNPFSSEGAEDTAWETKNTSTEKSSWGAAVDNNAIASDPDQSGGWGKSGGSWGQAELKIRSTSDDNQNSKWKNKTNDSDGNESSGWDSKSNWNTTKASGDESSGWNSVKMLNESPATGWGQGNGFKSGSNDSGNSNPTSSGWKSGTNGAKEAGKMAGTSDLDDNQDAGWKSNDQGGWSAGKASDGSTTGLGHASSWKKGSSAGENLDSAWGSGNATGSKSGLSEGAQEGSNWGKTGSSTVAENQDSDRGKAGNWNSVSGNAGGSEDNGWGQKSNWKSGSSDSNQTSNWGGNSNWNSNNSSGSDKNENKNSNWSSGHTDPGDQDFNWGKKSNWNSGNSGKPASDMNNSNWNVGSGDSNQNSNKGNNGNWNSNKSSWGAGNENKNTNWSSCNTDSQTPDLNWGKKSNWNSESGGGNQNTNWRSNWTSGNASSGVDESLNETSDDGGGENWRGGYRGRGGFRGGGFRGRGERGGFGGRGEHGGFGGRAERGGRGERGGFGGRGRSDREGFGGRWGSDRGYGGRGRGRTDQPGGWNNKQDSGEDGSSGGWKKGADNVEGWKNSSWSQSNAADKGQSSSWNVSADAGSWGKKNDGSDKGGW